MAEYDDFLGNSVKYQYIYAGGQKIAMVDASGNVLYYLNDHLGSARVVCDESGVIVDQYNKYDAFGESLDDIISSENDYKYTGKPYDSDGGFDCYYYGARYYDATLGRFMAIDPLQDKYPGISPFAYVANNPLKFVDPNGQGIVGVGIRAARRMLSKKLVTSARREAVRKAWAIEKNRLKNGLNTITKLTSKEKDELLKTGKVSGFEGHHINSVSTNDLQMAVDPNNIKFVKGRAAHLAEHDGNWRNPTSGPLLNRLSELSSSALLVFFITYDSKLQELLADCSVCSDDDALHSYVNPFNTLVELAAYTYAYTEARKAGSNGQDAYDAENGELE